jgi:Recombination endonuclease VII
MPLNAEQRRAWNARQRERRAQDPVYRAAENARKRASYQKHKLKIRERMQAYYQMHKLKIGERMQAYREARRDEIRERNNAYYQANKEVITERARVSRQARDRNNDPSLRNVKLRRYGISAAEYDALLEKQGGACAICRKRSKRRLCVDHCHLTGTVRGLLCAACNLALGTLKEDQASLVAALAYLGALPRDGPGFAAQRALAVHAVLPPWPTRRALLTYPPVRYDAAPRAAAIDADSLAPRFSTSKEGDDMIIDDAPPESGNTTQPMRDALDAELRRQSDDGEGQKSGVLQLIARKLATKALEGDLGAIREVFDRIDGKAVAGSAPEQTPGQAEMQWKTSAA